MRSGYSKLVEDDSDTGDDVVVKPGIRATTNAATSSRSGKRYARAALFALFAALVATGVILPLALIFRGTTDLSQSIKPSRLTTHLLKLEHVSISFFFPSLHHSLTPLSDLQLLCVSCCCCV